MGPIFFTLCFGIDLGFEQLYTQTNDHSFDIYNLISFILEALILFIVLIVCIVGFLSIQKKHQAKVDLIHVFAHFLAVFAFLLSNLLAIFSDGLGDELAEDSNGQDVLIPHKFKNQAEKMFRIWWASIIF